MTKTNDIHTNAILVNLSISTWSAARQDRNVSEKVEETAGARKGSGVYRKFLIDPNTPILKRIKQADTELRGYHIRMTLPWWDDGSRMLSAAAIFEYQQKISELKDTRAVLITEFISSFHNLKDEAQKNLGGMFNDKEYPSIAELREKFGVRIQLIPVPSGNDLRLEMNAADKARIQAEIETQVNEAVTNAVLEIFRRLNACICDMCTRIEAYVISEGGKAEHIFRDSAVDNLYDLVAIIPKLNVTNDKRITDIVDAIKTTLLRYSAAELRDDMFKRSEVIDAGKRMQSALAMLGEA